MTRPPARAARAPSRAPVRRGPDVVERRSRVLLSRVRLLQNYGLPVPEGTIRRALDLAKETADRRLAVDLLDRASTLLTQTRRRWVPVRDLLRRAESLRRTARSQGVVTDRFDRELGEVRAAIRTGPLTEALFVECTEGLHDSLARLEEAIAAATEVPAAAEPDPPAAPLATDPSPAPEPAPSPRPPARRPLADARSGSSRARPCPDCGRNLAGSYCPHCRMLWDD